MLTIKEPSSNNKAHSFQSFRNATYGLMVFIVFSFSDIYFQGVGRVFDYLFLIALIGYGLLFGINIQTKNVFSSASLGAVVLIWVLVGAINGNALASLAILVGIALVYSFYYRPDLPMEMQSLDTALRSTIAINAVVLVIQTFIYYQWGSFVDINSMVGSVESRGLNEGLNYFRPSGLFQEPNAYCAAMFSLLSLRILSFKSSDAVDYFGVLTMILTQSLWGFGASLVIIWLMTDAKKILMLSCSFAILLLCMMQFLNISTADMAESSVTLSRIVNIEDDPSRQARFGSLQNIDIDQLLFLGHGVDSVNFQSWAANSFGFLLYSFGVIGIILLFVWIFYIQKPPPKYVLVILFLFTTFPLFSYMYFWCWLGLLLGFEKANSIKPEQSNPGV